METLKLIELISQVEKRIPRCWAEDWDNPGLSVGAYSAEISQIAVALDANEKTVASAVNMGAQLLITHHPLIFKPLKSLALNDSVSRTAALAVKNDLAVYSAHTNWDSSPEGVNKILADTLGLQEIKPMLPADKQDGSWGIGAVGSFAGPITLEECLKIMRERWRIEPLSAYSNNDSITKAAVGGGSCGDMWSEALQAGAQLFITSDISYHQRQDALTEGLNLIITDHGDTERLSLPYLAKIIETETGVRTTLLSETMTYKKII